MSSSSSLIWVSLKSFEIIRIFNLTLVVAATVSPEAGQNIYQILDLVISVWFVIELALRITALTGQVFFSRWYNVADFVIILVTFVIGLTATIGGSQWAEKLAILTVLRFVRIMRLIRVCTERKQIETAARQMVSQNKRRYQQDGHDLDLTYVTKRVIATSFPSSGLTAMYVNDSQASFCFQALSYY